MSSLQEEFRKRTKLFALRILKLFQSLPNRADAQIVGKQLLRSGTSVGANYRAAGQARSHAEFVARIAIALEEADETIFWLELLQESGIVKSERLKELLQEANEITAILAASRHTAKSHAAGR